MKHQVIIVGSGPAGASTALHLAQYYPELAKRALVLERAYHPRPKLCAGGIVSDGERILRRLGLDLTELPHVSVTESRFLFGGRGFGIEHRPAVFRTVQRDILDAWLTEAVRARGVAVQEGTSVLAARQVGQVVELETNSGVYQAQAVVGADGARSVVRRDLASPCDDNLAVALEMTCAVETASDPSVASFQFGAVPEGVQGYVWSLPRRMNGRIAYTRGLYDGRVHRRSRHPNLKTALREALAREGLQASGLKVRGQVIRRFGLASLFSAPGVLLVGDAAGVDPILGEGISFALGYGELAALELGDAFERQDLSFAGYRDRVLTHPMGRCLVRRARVARLMYGVRGQSLRRVPYWACGFLLAKYTERRLIGWAG